MNRFLLTILAATLLSSAGCSGPHQPSANDAKTFVQSLLPSALRLSDFKADAPVRQPNTAPDGNAWTVNVKVTLTPAGDLLAPASLEQDHAFYAPISDLEDCEAWRNTYVRSIYCPNLGGLKPPPLGGSFSVGWGGGHGNLAG